MNLSKSDTPMNGANKHFVQRFYIYQKERFPFIAHGLLIASFTFSAIAYSRLCRDVSGFVSWQSYLVAVLTTVSLFFLVRIFDEFKDAEEDAMYRKHLPVPRGLISFRELNILAIITILFQLTINIFYHVHILWLYLVVIAFLLLMRVEFFVPRWLKSKPMIYALSHMFIIPLVDIYASGMDWLIEGVEAPKGLVFFFIVSYLNGMVLEFGRKIKTPENEEHNTYSTLFGANKATMIWLSLLFIGLVFSIYAASYAGHGRLSTVLFVLLFVSCSIPGILFLKKKTIQRSKRIESFSGIWTIAMYLILGGIPMLTKLLGL